MACAYQPRPFSIRDVPQMNFLTLRVRSGQWSQYVCDQTRRSRPTFSLPDPSARLRLRASVVGASIAGGSARHVATTAMMLGFHHSSVSAKTGPEQTILWLLP